MALCDNLVFSYPRISCCPMDSYVDVKLAAWKIWPLILLLLLCDIELNFECTQCLYFTHFVSNSGCPFSVTSLTSSHTTQTRTYLYFLKCKELYFFLDYATNIKAGAFHNNLNSYILGAGHTQLVINGSKQKH